MSPSRAIQRQPVGCEMHGCSSVFGGYLVAHGGITRRVCRPCMQEMTALYGWTYAGVAAASDSQVRVPATSSP